MPQVWSVGAVCRADVYRPADIENETKRIKRPKRAMANLSASQEAKIVQLSSSTSISAIADRFDIPYSQVRKVLTKNGIKITRGRKQGTGRGLRVVGGKKVDRRVAWQTRQIESGLCTSCGDPNDSDSMYHCKKCLKKRTDAKKKKNS